MIRRALRGCGWSMLAVAAVAAVGTVVATGGVAEAEIDAGRRLCMPADGEPGDLAIVNLTPVKATAPGHGVLTSSDVETPPTASNVNFAPGTVDPNVAVAPTGSDGFVCFHNSDRAEVDLAADLLAVLSADMYTPNPTVDGAPVRIADTRIRLGGSHIAPGERRCFPSGTTPGGLAVVNLTPVLATARGHGVLTSSEVTTPPTASNVNFAPGTVDPNLAITPIGTDGQVCFHNSPHAELDLIADLLVTLRADTVNLPRGPDGTPIRLVDTRIGLGGGRITPFEGRCWPTGATPGDLAVVNLTPLRATAFGHGVLTPSTLQGRDSSNVNFGPGTVDPNVAVTTVGADGALCFLNSPDAELDLVADVLVFLRPGAHDNTDLPSRLIDTRLEERHTFNCPTATRCYAAGNRFYISEDFGATWRLSESSPDLSVHGPTWSNTQIRCVALDVCMYQGYYRYGEPALSYVQYVTIDGGENWRRLTTMPSAATVACAEQDTCIAVGSSANYWSSSYGFGRRAALSNDGGRTWRDIDVPDVGTQYSSLTAIGCVSSTECSAISNAWATSTPNVTTLVTFATTDGWETVDVTEH